MAHCCALVARRFLMREALLNTSSATRAAYRAAVLLCVAVVATAALGAPAARATYGPTPVTHYNCPSDNSNNGHYVPYNHYWEQDFNAQGTSITGGSLALGANVGDHDHTAKIGIYTGSNRTGALAEIQKQVVGYGGLDFTFPTPISVTPGQHLYIAATGVGDFTAYDQQVQNGVEGCFIGRIDGYAPPPPDSAPPAVSQFTFTPSAVEVSQAGQDVTVSLHLADTPGGVKDPGSVIFRGPGAASVSKQLARTAGDENSGDYRAVVTVPMDAQPGTWTASLHGATDNANNTRPDGPPPTGSPTDLTVTSTHPDTQPPSVTGFDFSPKDVNAGDAVHVSIDVTDAAGPDNAGTDGPERLGFTDPSGKVVDAPVRPDPATSGRYLADVTIPRDAAGGTWTADIVDFHDHAGNHGPEGAPPAGLPRDLHVTAAPLPPPPPSPPPIFRYAIANVATVYARTGPGTNHPIQATLHGGWSIDIVCQTVGENINGSTVWDKLSNNAYVSDWFTTTPVVGDYSPGIPHCPGAPDQVHPPAPAGRWKIAATSSVNLRSGPGTGYSVVGSLGPGARFDVACQTYGTTIYGSPIWDKLTDGRYVADYFTDTPVFSNFSPGIPQCPGTGSRPVGAPPPRSGAGGGGGSAGGGVGSGSPSDCGGDIVFIGARGSGEGDHGFGNTVWQAVGPVTRRFKARVRLDSLDYAYPAMKIVSLDTIRHYAEYLQSVRDGTNTLLFHMRADQAAWERARCAGKLHFILAGFSQGAWVVGDAVLQMSPAERSRVAGVALFGDPRNPRHAGVYQGIVDGGHVFPGDIRSRVRNVCRNGDPVCDAPALRVLEHAHYQDQNGDAYQAGVWLADQLGRG